MPVGRRPAAYASTLSSLDGPATAGMPDALLSMMPDALFSALCLTLRFRRPGSNAGHSPLDGPRRMTDALLSAARGDYPTHSSRRPAANAGRSPLDGLLSMPGARLSTAC